MNTFEDAQKFGKEGFEALIASATAMSKGYQALAQEMAEIARKAVEHNSATFEKVSAARSFERVAEVQQTYAKEAYEAFFANATKIGEIYQNTAKDAYKPFESSMAVFGIKAPVKSA